MADFQNQVDDATTRRLMDAMTQMDADCDAAQQSVDSTAAYLRTQWNGNASGFFNGSLQQWQEGLLEVRRTLNDLNTAMSGAYDISIRLEEDNSASASWT